MSTQTLNELKAWMSIAITPLLLLIISFLIKDKLNTIESKLALIDEVHLKVEIYEQKIENINTQLIDLRSRIDDIKAEDFITLKNLKRDR